MSDRLSADKVMKFGMRGYKDIVKANWHGLIIDIKYLLTKDDEFKLIHSIINCCTTSEGEFVPEMVDMAMRACIVTTYASVDLPDDIDEQYKLLYHSTLFDTVKSNVNQAQINHIIKIISLLV